ncbi:hypothetical protein AX14_011409, partial [Amanita brunnescens Koide BX004]
NWLYFSLPSSRLPSPRTFRNTAAKPPAPNASAIRQLEDHRSSPAVNVDTADVVTLNDALGSTGVELRAAFNEHTINTSPPGSDDRNRKQPLTPSFDVRFLGQTMRTIGTSHKVARVPVDVTNYLALALRGRVGPRHVHDRRCSTS